MPKPLKKRSSWLRGIIMVVKEMHSKTSLGGNQLIFRYPPVVRRRVTRETLEWKSAGSLSATSRGRSALEAKEEAANDFQDAYNLPGVIVAEMLIPKPALCDQKFFMSVDECEFLGYPVRVSAQKKESEEADSLDIFNVTFVTQGEGPPHDLSQIAKRCAIALEHEERRCKYLTEQVAKVQAVREEWLNAQNVPIVPGEKHPPAPPNHSALASRILAAARLCNELRAIYHSLMETEGVNISINGWTTFAYSMSHSSFPERHLSSYLQRDHHHHHHHHYHRHALANSATNGNEDSTTVSASGAPAPWLPTSSEHAHAQSDGGGGNMAQLNGADRSGLPMKKPYSPFRPFHALLMLDNKASTNRMHRRTKHFPNEGSHTLRGILEVASPVRSFQELQLETGVPLAQLYRLAAHLLYWKQARIVDKVASFNVYVECASTKNRVAGFNFLRRKFSEEFPMFKSLEKELKRFSSPKTLGEVAERNSSGDQKHFVNMVVWLLKESLIVQFYRYVYLVVDTNTSVSSPVSSPPLPQLHIGEEDSSTAFASVPVDAVSERKQREDVEKLIAHESGDEKHSSVPSDDVSRFSDTNSASTADASAPQQESAATKAATVDCGRGLTEREKLVLEAKFEDTPLFRTFMRVLVLCGNPSVQQAVSVFPRSIQPPRDYVARKCRKRRDAPRFADLCRAFGCGLLPAR